jgi:hypothetical protein
MASELRCPQCGGPASRKWADVFTLNLVTFVIFGALSPVMLPFFISLACMAGAVLVTAWAAVVLVSLFALPVTGAIAVAAQPRCRLCGYGLWRASGPASPVSETLFPVRLALIGGVITVVPLVVGMVWVTSAPGQETWPVGLRVVTRIIMAVLALGVGLLTQAILWRVLRTRTTTAFRQGAVLLLPAVVLGGGWLVLTAHDHSVLQRKYAPLVRAPWVLARAQLGVLPASANNVSVHIFTFICSANYFLRFAAEPNDIEQFLEDSPSLKGVGGERYSKERMRIACRDFDQASDDSRNAAHDYFSPHGSVPSWYKEEIRGAGRRFETDAWEGKWFGEVIVDDEQHVVYVHVCRL